MNKSLIAISLVAALSACNQTTNQASNQTADVQSQAEQTVKKSLAEHKVLHSGIISENMDTSVKPGDDFNSFVNGKWIKNTEMPADKSRYGVFTLLHEKSQENVKKIIENSASGGYPEGSDEQKVGDLYASYLDSDTRNKLGHTPLITEFDKIDAIESHDQLAVHFSALNKLGYSTPFSFGTYVDFKDPKTYMVYTWQAGLGLPDREYYFKDDEESKSIRDKYVKHVAKLLSLAKVSDSDAKAQQIMALESQIAKEHMKKEQTRDMVALYNKFPTEKLTDVMPDFNWQGFLKDAGVSDVDGIVVTQVDYMKALNNIIKDTDLATWKTYLKWGVINANATFLSDDFDQANFDFYSKTLRGVEEQQPSWRRGVNIVNANLGEVVGKVYVKKHFPPLAKKRMQTLVDNLLKAYEISIKDLDWMTDETKVQALDKLSKFTPKIGYPDKWQDYSALSVKKDDLLGNMQRSALWKYEEAIKKQKGPVQKHEWAMTPQTVNAYYNPPLNEIVFPAAILQPPFFDLNADDAVNYGSIGAVIGHEIGHGFDDSGSTFDGDGVLRNWWTDADKAEFKTRTASLIEQYNGYEPLEGLHVNGEFTLGENIGDLGGLSITLLAYKLSLSGHEAPVMDGYTGEQRVFIGYAQSWLNKYRDKALRHQIETDPHSPAMYRVNGIVRNVPEFYKAFDVKEGDALYLAPEQRVKIW